MPPLARTDLDHILDHTRDLWDDVRGKRFFLSGGTGFVGCWLLESFAWANDKLGLNSEALVLTRNFEAFKAKAPHLANHPAIAFHVGDLRSFDFPNGEFSHVIHAATETSPLDPVALFEANVQATRRVLDFARLCRAKKFLFTSSGAVYGKQPPQITHIPEDYVGAPMTTDPQSAYGQSKRVSEFLCANYAQSYGLQTAIARCFAFVGPHLPLDANYAIGNFIRDAMRGGPIQITGDGTPYRSYLYVADLAIWLWTILFKGQSCRPYNVGSKSDLTIKDLAFAVAQEFPGVEICVAKQATPGKPAERYVPSIQRARTELSLDVKVELQDAIERTIRYHSLQNDDLQRQQP